jgi:hypothetical protein
MAALSGLALRAHPERVAYNNCVSDTYEPRMIVIGWLVSNSSSLIKYSHKIGLPQELLSLQGGRPEEEGGAEAYPSQGFQVPPSREY